MINPLFYAVRHGETMLNDRNEYRGWSNGPDAKLNSDGRDQARELGLFLRKLPTKISVIIASPLDRAQETAHIIADILGIPEVLTDKRLMPLNVGDLAGKPKAEHAITPYLKDHSKKFPGGESVSQFENREGNVFGDITSLIGKSTPAGSVLVVCHVSNIMFLYDSVNKQGHNEEYLDEKTDLVHPGGAVMFTKEGVIPIFKKNEGASQPLKDGTAVSGFVTDEENRPPRECWNCRWFVRDVNKLGSCLHPLVRIDPDLEDRRQADGTVAVGDRDCCDNFQNKIST